VKPTDDLLGKPLALVVALALVSLLPFLFMSLTAFVKISTVLQIVRSAIGVTQVPSNTVVMAFSAVLTLLAMAPVGSDIASRAAPLVTAKATPETSVLVKEGWKAVAEPLRGFLAANASSEEKGRFFDVAKKARERGEARLSEGKGETKPSPVLPDDFTVLAPAFMVTELTEAFSIGFLLYLPFLVIDLVIANVLLALGMQMLSPTQVSLPFKLLLFVAINGWGLLAQALVASYR